MKILMSVAAIISAVLFFLTFSQREARGDWIKFTRGPKRQCVILKEDKEFITFLTSYGEVKMPRNRIESVERDSEEINKALKEEWKPKLAQKEPEELVEAPEKKEEPARKYTVNVKRRRIMLGARASGVDSEMQVASFVIEDKGLVEGSHLFSVSVTSYMSSRVNVSVTDFHAVMENGLRIDPRPLKDYHDLKASLAKNESASGHLSFPTNAGLEKLYHHSDLADFELDLKTGEFTIRKGGF